MGWTHIPDIDSSAATSEENPFAVPKLQTPGKMLVQLTTDEWLCRKLNKRNLTLVEAYPSHSSEAGSLLKDQFVRPAKSKAMWLCSDQKGDSTAVSSWHSTGALKPGNLTVPRQSTTHTTDICAGSTRVGLRVSDDAGSLLGVAVFLDSRFLIFKMG